VIILWAERYVRQAHNLKVEGSNPSPATKTSDMFDRFKKNVYSQNGEDGILQELLKKLRLEKNGWCCEFGAWDGKVGSNTFNLVRNFNFNAVYIESDKKKFKDLKKTESKYPNILAINKAIDRNKNSNDSLIRVLESTKIPFDFEILSIDIDSYDLDVWETLEKYRPKIVVIEVNSSIKPGIIQRHDKNNQGNSFSATVAVGKKKGYVLICHTGNCIFLRNDLINQINFDDKLLQNPDILFDKSWLNKKNNIFKIVLKKLLPRSIVNILKKIID
tara:strand:- start:275 stop:1096 length:822 start_codon:yes stop_codon:yes gene_type:complete